MKLFIALLQKTTEYFFILFHVTLLKSPPIFSSVFEDSLGLSLHTVIFKQRLVPFLSNSYGFYFYFFVLCYYTGQESSTTVSKSGDSECPCLGPNLKVKDTQFSPSNKMLAAAFLQNAFEVSKLSNLSFNGCKTYNDVLISFLGTGNSRLLFLNQSGQTFINLIELHKVLAFGFIGFSYCCFLFH